MAKKLKPEDEAAVNLLRQRLVLTIQYIEDVQDFPSGKDMQGLVVSAAGRGDLRTLRLVAKEIDAMTVTLAPHEREELEELLLSRLGVDKHLERAEMRRKVAEVLQRGTIATEKERRRLEDYVEMLEATRGDPTEIEAVQQLLRSS